jgi:cyclophilin family peptidyl-prolyl cis-trans isomerase/protein-disulfide isomerase
MLRVSGFIQAFQHRSKINRRKHGFHYPALATNLSLLTIILFVSACQKTSSLTPTSTATASRTPIRLGPTSTSTLDGSAATQSPDSQTATATLYPLQPISNKDWSRGSPDAIVTLVIFMDFQSTECAWVETMLSQLLEWHPQDLRIVFRHFPQLYLYDKTILAAEAVEAAGAQGAFWEMHDTLYQKYGEWVELSPEAFIVWLKEAAIKIGLNQNQFAADIDNRVFAEDIVNTYLETAAAGIPGVPFIYFNGLWYRLPITVDNLEASIRLEMVKPRQYDEYPPFTIDIRADYIAYVEIPQGEIVIQLYPEYAPLAVNNFIFLAEQGWYDDNPIYEVEPGAWIESGDPSGTGWGGPGYVFENEISPSLTFDQAGMVAMVSEVPGTNASQFFITLTPLPTLNGTRTIFGRVIDGLDLLQDLEKRSALDDLLSEPEAVIHSVTIEGS